MESKQEAAMLRGSKSSKDNQPEHEKQDPDEREADDMAIQADQPSWTQAASTASAHTEPIESGKEEALLACNVSVPTMSDGSLDHHTSGDEADRSATPSPPLTQDYAVNMLRSSVMYEWNDSGDDDEDSVSEEDSYFSESNRRPCSPSQLMESVIVENQRHQHGMPRRARFTSFRDVDDDESVSDSEAVSGLRGGDLPRYIDTDWIFQVCHRIGNLNDTFSCR